MKNDLELSLIVAMGENDVIGCEGSLPSWKLGSDMDRFVRLTKEHGTVIVGRKTHESILKHLGHPLTERVTIVLTRKLTYKSQRCIVVSNWGAAVARAAQHGKQAMVIGGAEIYRMALPHATTMYLTRVHGEFEGDVRFPAYDENEWEVVKKEGHPANQNNSHTHTFFVLKRKGFVNLSNARLEEQRTVMEQIQEESVCPFCPEHLSRFHKEPVLRKGNYWILTYNQWPYENTRVHLLAIAKEHAECLSDLPPDAGRELLELMQWAEQEFEIEGGGLGMRFGSTSVNGATVAHLHAQLLSADITDKNHPNYKKVHLRVG